MNRVVIKIREGGTGFAEIFAGKNYRICHRLRKDQDCNSFEKPGAVW
ncbi:MAG: hypothetical protein LBR93_12010 [Treponema sp.]|jgi:hypothetical protein|nr:hypothetical protein [Treponema sp.]